MNEAWCWVATHHGQSLGVDPAHMRAFTRESPREPVTSAQGHSRGYERWRIPTLRDGEPPSTLATDLVHGPAILP